MKRSNFLKTSLTLAAGWPLRSLFAKQPPGGELIIGHGDYRYRINLAWGTQDPARYPVNDCHEMVFDRKGRIFLLTNETKNNVLIYNKDGKVLDAWGTEFPGAHGLTLVDEGGEEMLYICDYERHEVIKTTLAGKQVQVFPYPADSGKYPDKTAFKPTETAVAPNGDVFIADGYGQDWIVQYGADGHLKNMFGGKGTAPENLNNAHGVALDTRKAGAPSLLVTSRVENTVKSFSLDGKLLGQTHLPGAYICRPVVHGANVYFAVLISKIPWDSQSGFVCILDADNKLVSAPGACTPAYNQDGSLQTLYQTVQVFKHPHDVLPDADGNIYVAQWNSGKVYPARLERV